MEEQGPAEEDVAGLTVDPPCDCTTGPVGQDWGGRPCDACGGRRPGFRFDDRSLLRVDELERSGVLVERSRVGDRELCIPFPRAGRA